MSYDDDNVFAKILRGEIPCNKIYEDEFALAAYDIRPAAPTHALVMPKGKFVSADDFNATATTAEITGFYRAISHVAQLLGVSEAGYRLIANAGPHSHQEVPHYHVHILAGRPLGPLLTTPDPR